MKTNRLSRLLASNKTTPRSYRIENAGAEASVFLYDVIGDDPWSGGGVSAAQFSQDLRAIRADVLHLHFNSPGGDVFEGRAMAAALGAHPARKVGHVDGLAASAASFLLMHCNEVAITDGAMLMIHNGWTLALGDRHEFRTTAALLEKIDGAIADDYARRVNVEREQVQAWMDAETWFTAAEAIQHGFADRLDAPHGDQPAKARWNLAAFDRAPIPPPELEPEPAPEPVAVAIETPANDARWQHNKRRLAAL